MKKMFLWLFLSGFLLVGGDKRKDPVELVLKTSWTGPANTITIISIDSIKFESDGNYVSHTYILRKALTMTGAKELGFLSFPYDTLYWIVEIKKARVIKPSGEVIDVGPEYVKDEPMKSILGLVFYGSMREKSITFPSVEIGGGIEVEIVYRTKKPRIEGVFDGRGVFGDDEPVKYTKTVLVGPREVKLNTAIVNNEKGIIKFKKKSRGKLNVFVWEAFDIQPVVPERGMAPITDFVPQVLWSNTTWTELSKKVYNLVRPMMVADSIMEATVKELTSGIYDEEEKMRRIFYYVAQEIRYLGVSLGEYEGIQPHPANLTFSRREGVCKDKATLLATLLNLAGIESYTVLTNPTNKIFKDVAVSYFNHMVTAAKLKSGKIYFMDSTDELARDLLPAYSYNKEYLPILPEGSDLMVFPVQDPQENSELVNIETKLSHTGLMTAIIEFSPSGFYDELWRMVLQSGTEQKRKQFFTKLVKSIHPNCRLDSLIIKPSKIKNLYEPVRIRLVVSCDDYAIPAGRYFLFKPVGYLSAFDLFFPFIDAVTTLEKRLYPIDLYLTLSHTIKETVIFPAGFVPYIVPEDRVLTGEVGEFSFELSEVNNGLELKRSFVIKDPYIEPSEYPQLKEISGFLKGGEKGYVFLVKEEK